MSEEEKLITFEDYELTNINLDNLHYVIRLKDDKEYSIYKGRLNGKRRDYIIKNNEKIFLSKEVQDRVNADIREYERYGI